MFKHKAIVAAVLSVAAFSAQAASQITQDPWVFYAPNPVADPVPTPSNFKRADIRKDLYVFYAPNPVADPTPTQSGFKYAEVYPDTGLFYAAHPVPAAQPRAARSIANNSATPAS